MARSLTVIALLGAFLCLFLQAPDVAQGRSASSPRHTGMEPPGGPRPMEMIPGNGPSRAPNGGMGYMDAYGNTLEDRAPEEKKPRHRPGPGAYGGYGKKKDSASLPDPKLPEKPLWSFQ